MTLDSRWMWQNTALVQRLGAIHVQAALAGALWAIAGPLEPRWQIQRPGQLGAELYRHPLGLVAAVVIGYGVVVLAVPSFSRHDRSTTWHKLSRVLWILLAVSWVVVAARLLLAHRAVEARYLSTAATGRVPLGGLPGYSASVLGLFLSEVCVLLALTAVVVVTHAHARRRPHPMTDGNARVGFLGFGSVVMATSGMFLASVFSAGEYLFTAGWLHTGSVKPSFHDMSMVPTAFHLPEVIELASLAYTFGVIGLVLAVLGAGVWFALAAASRWYGLVDLTGFALDYPGLDPGDPGSTGDLMNVNDPIVPRRRQEILRAYFLARLVDFAGNALVALVAFGATVSGVLSLILFGEHVGRWGWAERSARWLADSRTATHASVRSSIPGLEVVGAYLTVLTILLMVSLGSLAFRVPATRRSVGILWDIASFWPRTAHPLAAPCYAERTVPDLITRIRWYRAGPARPTGVLLAGHSQGTVISFAALIQLAANTPQRPPANTSGAPDDVLDGVSFLTFGCVLRRLYGRYFPVYFGAPVFDLLARHLGGTDDRAGRWLNLWRYTDYLGGPVTDGPPSPTAPPDVDRTAATTPIRERHLRDPAFFAVQPGDTVAGPPLRHSDFWKSPDGSFQTAVAELAAHLESG